MSPVYSITLGGDCEYTLWCRDEARFTVNGIPMCTKHAEHAINTDSEEQYREAHA